MCTFAVFPSTGDSTGEPCLTPQHTGLPHPLQGLKYAVLFNKCNTKQVQHISLGTLKN